jgi:hypothetical protein
MIIDLWGNLLKYLQLAAGRAQLYIPIFGINQKLVAIQVLNAEQRISLAALDSIALKLWRPGENLYMPVETRNLLFETDSRYLSETERYIKLRLLLIKARTVLIQSRCLVEVVTDEFMSSYTGWEKDPIELLIDRAESHNTFVSADARTELLAHPKLQEYLTFQIKSGRHGLVNRAMAIIIGCGS